MFYTQPIQAGRTLPMPQLPLPFPHTPYFAAAMARPDRQGIRIDDIVQAVAEPIRIVDQPDGRRRLWCWVAKQKKWLRVIVEKDGVTVHNAFWDRRFKP